MIDMNINSYVNYVAQDLTTITHSMTILHQTPNTSIFIVEMFCDLTLFHNIHKLISLGFGLCFKYLHHNFNTGFFYNLKEIHQKMKKIAKNHVSIIMQPKYQMVFFKTSFLYGLIYAITMWCTLEGHKSSPRNNKQLQLIVQSMKIGFQNQTFINQWKQYYNIFYQV